MALRSVVLILATILASLSEVSAQDDLLSLLGEDEETVDYAFASFKTNRVINLHSLENTSAGVLDIKISHRFGMVNTGFYELFGLDAASIRIGGDYGLTENMMIGFGRSSFQKTYDGYVKYRLLRQSSGAKVMPVTLSYFSSIAVIGTRWPNPARENYFSSRLFYTHQLIVGRKFSEAFSLQLSPTVVHRNMVETEQEAHDVLSLGVGTRLKLTKRMALNLEYIYVFPDQLEPGYRNSLSIGLDIETGGHVFQLHFTNSTSMIEKGFITETTGDWGGGGVHFGFNVSRVFTIRRPNIKE